MTEQEFAFKIRRALDDRAEHLPFKVTHRLEAARAAALGAMTEASKVAVSVRPVAVGPVAIAGGAGRRWRLALTVAPLVLLLAGAVSIPFWDETRKAEETSELDEAVLTDDLPISAYADRGFGVYLRNTRQ